MKKIVALLLMSLLVFTVFSGCSKPAPAVPAEPAPADAPAAPSEPPASEVTDKDGILSLMAESPDVMKNGLSYDYVMTVADQVITSRFSFKGDNIRMEGLDPSNPSLMITKGKELFIINPQEKTGFKMTTELDSDANPSGEIKPEENMDKDSLQVIGKEDVDGEPCYIVMTKNLEDDSDMKLWLHQKYGIMMKMESQTSEGTLLMEVKNLKVGNIPDSDFEIPADIEIMEMPGLPQ